MMARPPRASRCGWVLPMARLHLLLPEAVTWQTLRPRRPTACARNRVHAVLAGPLLARRRHFLFLLLPSPSSDLPDAAFTNGFPNLCLSKLPLLPFVALDQIASYRPYGLLALGMAAPAVRPLEPLSI